MSLHVLLLWLKWYVNNIGRCRLKRNQIAHTKTERRVLQSVRHPFIVELKFAWQTRDKLYLVTDYAPGGELFFWLKRQRAFSQALVQLYAAELVLAIEHLHSKDVVYRYVLFFIELGVS